MLSQFSDAQPKLQTAWDATSLSALMKCPRYYQYSILEGWRKEGNEHLEFGGFFASAVELFKKALLLGVSKEQATLDTLRWVIERTFDPIIGPWSGAYSNTWHCAGDRPYRNAKGNRAKCPWAHAGTHVEGVGPTSCGSCEGSIVNERRWLSSYNAKDRYGLVRLVAAYCDEAPSSASEGAFPIAFPNGQPAVELSFTIPLPWHAEAEEPYVLVGHLDSIMQFGDEHFITDNKTTSKTLNQRYWQTFSPNTQVDTYDLAGTLLWPELHIQGVLIEGAQVLNSGLVRLGVGSQYRTDEQREEFLAELEWWLQQAESFALKDYWPMNRKSCYGCDFAQICSVSPSKRQAFLESNFVKKHWNPLEER